jgi:hypothetical protein
MRVLGTREDKDSRTLFHRFDDVGKEWNGSRVYLFFFIRSVDVQVGVGAVFGARTRVGKTVQLAVDALAYFAWRRLVGDRFGILLEQ